MKLFVRCNHLTERATGRNHPTHPCQQRATVVILTEEEIWHAGDVTETLVIAYPYCDQHAPEEVHEARVSMNPGEFAVATIQRP